MLGLLISDAYAMAGAPGAGAGQPGGAGGIMSMLPMLVAMLAIFYFLMIRPQQKQAKKIKQMLESVKRGDEIVTRSGIHAKVHGIAEGVVTLEIADNVKIKMNKDQIGYVKTPGTNA